MTAPQPIKVRNPRTGEYDAEIVPPSFDALDRQVAALRAAQADWQAAPLEHRIAVLQDWKGPLTAARHRIVAALAADTGRNRISAVELDIVLAAIDRWCGMAPDLLRGLTGRSGMFPDVRFESQEVPYELVAVISPWNFPLTLSLTDTIPALLAGCAVMVKPSEVTPRFAAPLQETVAAVPGLAAVLDFVLGAGDVGAALVDRADAVCFTGSVRTGRMVAEQAARRFIPAFLELGGKDPLIVLEGADLDRAVEATLRASISNTGQACQSVERIYVARPIHDEFARRLAARAATVELNYPDPHQGDIGPLIFEEQAAIIADHIADAVAKGARVLTGGEIEHHGGGLWIRPTVMTHVTHHMKVMREETFGPIMPVMAFDTVDEAVALANDSAYGLSGGVIGATPEEAMPVARRIRAGGVSVHDAGMTALTQEAEKNSFNLSGLGGSRMGAPGILRFIRRKALIVNEGATVTVDAFKERPD